MVKDVKRRCDCVSFGTTTFLVCSWGPQKLHKSHHTKSRISHVYASACFYQAKSTVPGSSNAVLRCQLEPLEGFEVCCETATL